MSRLSRNESNAAMSRFTILLLSCLCFYVGSLYTRSSVANSSKTEFEGFQGECLQVHANETFSTSMLTSSEGQVEKRVAFVVGIEVYDQFRNLPNAAKDAAAIANQLTSIGFDTFFMRNAERDELIDCFNQFAGHAKMADLKFVYFAGHGIQISDQNFVVAFDADISQESPQGLVSVSWMLETLANDDKKASPAPTIVLLDACRDNGTSQFSDQVEHRIQAGLAAADLSGDGVSNLFIGYATSPESFAADGDGEHSPYATGLLSNLASSGLRLEAAMSEVAKTVGELSDWTQSPWTRSSLTESVYLNGDLTSEDAARKSKNHASAALELLNHGATNDAILEALKGIPPHGKDAMREEFENARNVLSDAAFSNNPKLPLKEMVGASVSIDGSRLLTSGFGFFGPRIS